MCIGIDPWTVPGFWTMTLHYLGIPDWELRARRKPKWELRTTGVYQYRYADRQIAAS